MCCGKNRTQQRTTTGSQTRTNAVYPGAHQQQPARVYFVYVGNTRLTLRGPISGMHYSFDRPGARVEVDARDRALLSAMPQLRQVR